jgi:hypothetical protein
MFKFLTSPRFAEIGSALLVVVSAWIVGRYAAQGLSPIQWACGIFAIMGSISVAIMVRMWPAPVKVEVRD